jgi:hypothetical protein
VTARFGFDCLGVRSEPYALTPTLAFTVRVSETTGATVHAFALRCQIRVEPRRRQYTEAEAERMADLFGDRSRWEQTQRPMQMATVSTLVRGFTGSTDVDVPVPCSYDLEIASTRYFHALDDGTVALLLLFSGTVFLDHGAAPFAVQQVPWSAESPYRMPVAVWREMVERDFPGSAWLRCSRDTLDALGRFKSRHALPTWDHTIRALLAAEHRS